MALASASSRYGFHFRKVNHLVRYSVDERTGEYRSEIQPCDSATCSRTVCQQRAVRRRVQALRYVLRKREARPSRSRSSRIPGLLTASLSY